MGALRIGAPAAHAAGEVNLSRHVLSVGVPAAAFVTAVQPVDQAVLVAFCGDTDGCTARLKMERTYGVLAGHVVVYLSTETPLSWTTDSPTYGAYNQDASGFAQLAVEVHDSKAHCYFMDGASAALGSDDDVGFSLVVTNEDDASPATCVLVLID